LAIVLYALIRLTSSETPLVLSHFLYNTNVLDRYSSNEYNGCNIKLMYIIVKIRGSHYIKDQY